MPNHNYTQLKSTGPPDCDRCRERPVKIKCIFYKENNRVERICLDCKLADPVLRDLPVKPKRLPEAQKELLFSSLEVPNVCDRCSTKEPKIRKFDNADNSVEFMCKKCVISDKELKRLPIKKKASRKDSPQILSY